MQDTHDKKQKKHTLRSCSHLDRAILYQPASSATGTVDGHVKLDSHVVNDKMTATPFIINNDT